jgi:hypothetical protein
VAAAVVALHHLNQQAQQQQVAVQVLIRQPQQAQQAQQTRVAAAAVAALAVRQVQVAQAVQALLFTLTQPTSQLPSALALLEQRRPWAQPK